MRITKRQLRRIIREAANDYGTMANDFKTWARRNFPSWPQLYPTHLALIAYAREHGLNRADAEELADALDMHFRDRQLVSYAMGGPLGISEKVNRTNRTGRTR